MTFGLRNFLVLFVAGILVSACASNVNSKNVRPQKKELIVGVRVYTVKKGDTLYSIGLRSGHGYKRLAEWNRLKPPYKLLVGQKIKLFPPPVTGHTQKKASTGTNKTKKMRIASQKKGGFSKEKQKLLKLSWQWPLKGRVITTFAQSGNKGIDIHGKNGQSVRAAEAGKVVYSGRGLTGYGNLVIIKHDASFLSAYANNSKLLVKDQELVKKGQVIAEVGFSKSRKSSLHFEIRKNGKPVNPIHYLPKL